MVEILLSPTAWLVALGIFFARTINIALDTLRFMFTMRGKNGCPGCWVLSNR
jgi:hypothetical protein